MSAFSKSQVDRAGRNFSDSVRGLVDGTIPPRDREALEALVKASEVIEWWRSEHARPLSQVAASLRHYATDHGAPVVTQRLKRLPTIADKLLRQPTMKLSRMGDIGGVRAILPNQKAAYDVASRLRRNWTITQFRDYVSNPKEDGYRALHLINRHRGKLIEVQLRTQIQDIWANLVEEFSRDVAPGLKFGKGPEPYNEFFVLLAESLTREGFQDSAHRARFEELTTQISTLRRRADEP